MTVEHNARAEEYADYDGPLLPASMGFDLSRLVDPASLRAIAVVVGATVLIVADRTPQLYAWVIGGVLIVSGIRTLAGLRSRTGDHRSRLAMSIAFVTAGAALVF